MQLDFAKAEFLQSLQAHQRALLQMGATIHDLEEAELCFAPQFGSAGDPVNSAGKWLCSERRHAATSRGPGYERLSSRFANCQKPLQEGPEALNIPVGKLRSRLGELPRDREIHVYGRFGQGFYIATRILLQNGFKATNISSGMFLLAQSDLMTDPGEAALRRDRRARSALLEAHVLAVRNCSAS